MDIKDRFPELFSQYKDMYYKLAFSFMGNEDDAVDAVCEMSLKAWAKLPLLKNDDSFRAWSTAILVNVCKTKLKKQKRETQLEDMEIPDDIDIEQQTAVRNAVEHLPLKFKEVIILRYYNGFELSMISKTLRIPLGTVKSRLNRSLAILEKELGDIE